MDIRKRLEFVFNGAQTKRFHGSDTLLTQTVGSHSFGVAWLCELLTEGAARGELLLAALSHDLAEHKVGDVASPTKRLYPDLKRFLDNAEEELLAEHQLNYESHLNADEKRTLKLADYMEGMLHCTREMKFGNSGIIPALLNFYTYTCDLKPRIGIEQDVFRAIIAIWNETTIKGAKL